MTYALAFPKYSNRPMYYESRQADITWIPDLRLGVFPSILAAKRFYLVAMQEIKGEGYTDQFINRLFRPFQNMKHVKVVKVTNE